MAKTILILAANPSDTPPLRLDQEVREIDNGLERSRKRDEFILKQKWASRASDVRRAMLDFRPNIIHFCGHGSGGEGIAFEDEIGKAKFVDADTLADFFELFANRVECVVLNACYSELQAEAIAKHIPYVIGMKKAIGDTAAIEFSIAFYDALGAGESVEFAYKLACNAIKWSGMPEHLTPTIKLGKSTPSKEQSTSFIPCLSRDTIESIIQQAISCGLVSFERRPLLLMSISPEFVYSLPTFSNPLDQFRSDLYEINRVARLEGLGDPPITIWLMNAIRLAQPRPEKKYFEQILREIKRR